MLLLLLLPLLLLDEDEELMAAPAHASKRKENGRADTRVVRGRLTETETEFEETGGGRGGARVCTDGWRREGH